MKRLKKDGFSLVELLAVVVILGIIVTIGIATTSMLTNRAKEAEMDSYKNTIKMSAQTYLQNNKNLVPKVVGESKVIKVRELRENNYLTKDIKNKKGESCMENSYVRVYKLSNTEYTYTPYIYCGDEEVPEEEVVPKPKIIAKFTDSSGIEEEETLNNVSDAYLFIDISAASDDELLAYKNANNEIKIDGYSFKIYIVKNDVRQEAYNSGSLSAGREEKLLINKRLQEYIDVTGITEVYVEVTAINTLGGSTSINKSKTKTGETELTQYNDTVRPKCVAPTNPYTEEDWVNKQKYAISKEARKLTVGCDDGTGSQCIRSYFTKSWPNEEETLGAEYVYIKVKDNAGNESCVPTYKCNPKEKNCVPTADCDPIDVGCKFRVNVDIQTPTATVSAYVGKESNSNESSALAVRHENDNILKKKIEANDIFDTASIEPTDEYYERLFGVDETKWLNKANYPYGVVYEIILEDNIRLDKWTWMTNEGYIDDVNSSNYKNVSISNPEATSGITPQDAAHGLTDFHGSISDKVYVRFLTEGKRYGVFKAYDKAGNSIEITIAANLDRTAPPVPEHTNANVYNKEREAGTSPSSTVYTFGEWTNRYVRVKTNTGYNIDNYSNNTTLAGFWQFYYNSRNNSGNAVGTGDYSTYVDGIGIYDFKGLPSQVDGINKIQFKGCDKANNCSEYGILEEVWIDITNPVCTVTKVNHGSESAYGWLGIQESATVTASCNDPTSTRASGCTIPSFSHTYDYPINTESAGAQGKNNGGIVSDYAGNTDNCAASETVRIDYVKPTCTVTGGSAAWTNKSRTITGTCNDTGGSGCVTSISKTYNTNTNTTEAGAVDVGQGGSVKDKADNEIHCLANQPVRVDIDKPYVTYDPPNDRVYQNNDGLYVTATCHDGFSGLSNAFDETFSGRIFSPTTSMGIGKCCQDKAGNRFCGDSGLYKIQFQGRHSSCGVESHHVCRTDACDVESYNECRTKACGISSYNSCRTKACGVDYYEWTCASDLGGTRMFKRYSYEHPFGGHGYCGKSGTIYNSCANSACGVKSYKKCENVACGVHLYKLCEDEACGVKYHSVCWSFNEPCCDADPHPAKK